MLSMFRKSYTYRKLWRVRASSFFRRYAKGSKVDASFIFRFHVARLRKGFYPLESPSILR